MARIIFNIIGSHNGLVFKSEAVSGYVSWATRTYTQQPVLYPTTFYQGGNVIANAGATIKALYFRKSEPENSIGYGYYKITVSSTSSPDIISAYFYYDTRTSEIHNTIDVYFDYNVVDYRFSNKGRTNNINETTQLFCELLSGIGPEPKYSPYVNINVDGFAKEGHQPTNLLQQNILHQNYPNPFNPNTIIKYSLAESSPVELKVFDILGNELVVLIKEFQDAGTYSILINMNEISNNVADGVYIYQLKTNKYFATKKFMYLK